MTTPTREQVVQMARRAFGMQYCPLPVLDHQLERLVAIARADLEATIVDQAKQIEEMAEAIKKAADQIRVCDYTPARSTLLVAIAVMSHKESRE